MLWTNGRDDGLDTHEIASFFSVGLPPTLAQVLIEHPSHGKPCRRGKWERRMAFDLHLCDDATGVELVLVAWGQNRLGSMSWPDEQE